MIMVILVHMMITHQAAIVIEVAMVLILTIQFIEVEVPTEIHMRVMVLHLHEGPCHLVVEAASVMITAAYMMDMVEVKAVEVISTQVVVIWLADKKEAFPLLWKRRYPPPCDSYNTSSHKAPRGGGCEGS